MKKIPKVPKCLNKYFDTMDKQKRINYREGGNDIKESHGFSNFWEVPSYFEDSKADSSEVMWLNIRVDEKKRNWYMVECDPIGNGYFPEGWVRSPWVRTVKEVRAQMIALQIEHGFSITKEGIINGNRRT